MTRKYFITAIDTDSGKTLVSAIFTEALGADYWKPVQAGSPGDADQIRNLVSNKTSQVLKERYYLNTPASPHAAAKIDGVHIALSDFEMPATDNDLIVEGAGGLLVPLNDQDTVADLIKALELPVVLVSNLYLGSINHTLLSANYLKQHQIPVAGIVFNGESNPESERIIELTTGWPVLLRIKKEKEVNPAMVSAYADQLLENLGAHSK